MISRWNTRKFGKTLSENLCHILKEIPSHNQILAVQPQIVPFLSQLISFSQLTESTPARKIILLDEQAENNIRDIVVGMEDMTLVFIIDIRTELIVPDKLTRILGEFRNHGANVIYCTWKNQISNRLLDSEAEHQVTIPHFIKSQLKMFDDIGLYAWNILPVPEVDDNLLLCDLLFNNEGDNMYAPSNYSMQGATRGILVDNMVNCLQSLIEETNSTVTHTVSLGDESKKFLDLLHKRIEDNTDRKEHFIKDTLYGEKYSGLETDLIVLDRDMDPLTPLLTQLTYAGLLDDLHEFMPGGKLKYVENVTLKYQDDEIWDSLKYMNFGALGPMLNQSARELQESYDSRHKAESVGEIRQFVDSLGSLQGKQKLLKMHTSLSSDILGDVANNEDYNFNRVLEIEQDLLLQNLENKGSYDAIMDLNYENQVEMRRILRLACISSVCKDGLRDKDYESMKRELIDSYGIEICFQLQRLTLAGLFTSKSLIADNIVSPFWKREYRYISSWLDTLPPIDDEEGDQNGLEGKNDATHPKDATFAYCGVVPLTTRFIQLLYDRTVLSKNYSSQQPFILSREPSIAKTGELFEQIYGTASVAKQESWLPPVRKNRRRVTIGKSDKKKANDIAIIVFLGGVTLGEVSTIRFLQDRLREKDINKRFIIVSDGLINGNRTIDSAINVKLRTTPTDI